MYMARVLNLIAMCICAWFVAGFHILVALSLRLHPVAGIFVATPTYINIYVLMVWKNYAP